MTNFREVWRSFSAIEKRNIAFYIAGIMLYKVGLEFFNGSITTLATDRFTLAHTFTKLGAASGVNQAAQCVGAILIAPMIKRWPTRTVLSGAIFVFALMTAILLIVDASTGGEVRPQKSSGPVYGHWPPNIIFCVWTLAGIAYGMVELIRRVIPVDIVGGHVRKLRRLDAMVHIFYEITGTAGAFASSSAISRWGNNYSFLLTPIFFAAAGQSLPECTYIYSHRSSTSDIVSTGVVWVFVSALSFVKDVTPEDTRLSETDTGTRQRSNNYFVQLAYGVLHFGESIFLGTKLVFGKRSFIWLSPSYALALYLHRFLENSLAPAFAKRVLNISAWSQIIVGGSNFGELMGALSVFLLTDYVTTPLPWLRLDALALNIVWVLPYFSTISKPDVSWAWRIGGLFIPISYGWAAGDVSLAAYIQATLSKSDLGHRSISGLGAVMAHLYSTYIVLNAVLSAVLGTVIDNDFNRHGNITNSLRHVAGIQFSVCSGIILCSTFIPQGAWALNPKVIGGVKLDGDEDNDRDDAEKIDGDVLEERDRHTPHPPHDPSRANGEGQVDSW